MRVTHYNEVKKLQKRVKKAEKENEKDKDVEKEVKKSETLPPQSPPQYSERMSDISSIRTATTLRSDRETLKVSKIICSYKSALVWIISGLTLKVV